jgi:hypothetical protein
VKVVTVLQPAQVQIIEKPALVAVSLPAGCNSAAGRRGAGID